MEESDYQRWWALHVRAVRGDALTENERAAYEAGLRELHKEEVLQGDISLLRKAREVALEMDAKCDELQDRRRELKAELARMLDQ